MKPFEPSPSRLERARREGDHPISRDVVAVASFGGALLALSALVPLAPSLSAGLRNALDAGDVRGLALALAAAVGLTATCGGGAAILATLLQTRGLAVRMPAMRLAIGRTFSRDTWTAAARSAATVAAGGLAIVLTAAPNPHAIEAALAAVGAIGAGGAVADLFAMRAAWRRRWRMTQEELRRDVREQDGDPQMRGRRRRLHRALMRGSLREVRRATFVVVNPTHVAVALRYVPPRTPIPEILVRAADAKAARMRALAAQDSIPMIEDPPLARQLYAHDALGPIPPEAYVAVAQIVAFLHRTPSR
jgi:flagellar biosynthetic protein FlhB